MPVNGRDVLASRVDALLKRATGAGDVPGVVAMATAASAAEKSPLGSASALMTAFDAAMVSGAFSASSSANFCTYPSSSASGSTRLTRPMANTSSAL